MHIGDTSAVKMLVMARPLLDLCWAGTRLEKHSMKSVTEDHLPGIGNPYVFYCSQLDQTLFFQIPGEKLVTR